MWVGLGTQLDAREEEPAAANWTVLGGAGSRVLCSSPPTYIGAVSGFGLGVGVGTCADLRWDPVGLLGLELGLSSKIRRCPNPKFFLLGLLLLIFLLMSVDQKYFWSLVAAFVQRGWSSDPDPEIF